MSKILNKVFDSSKKIIRSVFLGAPNLLTTSDVNRQFEALKYQIDQLDEKTGLLSDCVITPSVSGSTLNVSFAYSYLSTKGCTFKPAKSSLSTNFTKGSPTVYVCLTAETELVDYNSDASHEISGAKFADGTSLPAASQLVYKNEKFILTHSITDVTNLVGIVAIIERSETGNAIIRNNCVAKNSSLSMGANNSISDLDDPSTDLNIKVGDSYDVAFSKVKKALTLSNANAVTSWKPVTNETGDPVSFYYQIKDGLLCIRNTAISQTGKTGSLFFGAIDLGEEKMGWLKSKLGESSVRIGSATLYSDENKFSANFGVYLQISSGTGVVLMGVFESGIKWTSGTVNITDKDVTSLTGNLRVPAQAFVLPIKPDLELSL